MLIQKIVVSCPTHTKNLERSLRFLRPDYTVHGVFWCHLLFWISHCDNNGKCPKTVSVWLWRFGNYDTFLPAVSRNFHVLGSHIFPKYSSVPNKLDGVLYEKKLPPTRINNISHQHVEEILFKNFSATSTSNGGFIEWWISLFHLKIFFGRSMYVLN